MIFMVTQIENIFLNTIDINQQLISMPGKEIHQNRRRKVSKELDYLNEQIEFTIPPDVSTEIVFYLKIKQNMIMDMRYSISIFLR